MKLPDLVCLGIESTAHTFGVSVVQGAKVLSNEKKCFTTTEGGMVPSEVADHHVSFFDEIFVSALSKSKKSIKDIDLIAFSSAPGIGHSLRIGAFFARTLALKLKKPLIPINHCIAHLEIGRILSGAKDPVLLYASGANTQIIAYEASKYRVFGETLDVGVGNFLDSLGRFLNLGFPAGPKIEQLAKKGKNYIELPYSVKGMDVSFGGLLTNLKHKIKENKYAVEDLCFSVQETVFAMLTEVVERALAHTDKSQVLLGGGVACNSRLQEMISIMCEERGAKSFVVENEFLVDNAAMIALTGVLIYSVDKKDYFNDSKINPYQRTDDVVINYRS